MLIFHQNAHIKIIVLIIADKWLKDRNCFVKEKMCIDFKSAINK